MAYRNDVAVVIRADEGGGANIVRLWNAYVEQYPGVVEALEWGIPWYTDAEVPALVEEWIEQASNADGVSLAYVRIGDDLDDVDIRWDGAHPPQLGVTRTVTGW